MFAPLIAALLASSAPAAFREKDAMLPFPSVLLGTGGGGGGGVTRFIHVGNTGASATSMASFVNGLCAMSPVTPATAGSAYAVCLRQLSTTPAGTKLKAVIYSDASGQPGNLLAVGNEYTTLSLADPMDISLTLATPFAVTAGTKYWVGAIANGVFNADGPGGGTNTLWWYSGAYATPAATAPAMSHNGNTMTSYLSIGDSAAVAATIGFVADNTGWITTASYIRDAWPADRAPGDIGIMHVTFLNTSGAPLWVAPEGWTLINEHGLGGAGNYRELIYWRRIDGTEAYACAGVSTANTSVLQLTVSLWRGYVAAGTPYEAFASNGGTNTNPSGSTITTLGANRTVVTFYSQSTTTALGNANANGWSEKYQVAANNCLSACSSKDVAVAGAVTAEARTEASQWWGSSTLALIKA